MSYDKYYEDDSEEVAKVKNMQRREAEAKAWRLRKKQASCPHKNAIPPNGMGFGECFDCGAVL